MEQTLIYCICGQFKPQLVLDYHQMKTNFPKSLVGIEYKNAIYFFGNDAECVSLHCVRPIDTIQNTRVCVLPSEHQHTAAITLFKQSLLMSVIKEATCA